MQLSVKDAASLLKVSEDAVYRWVKEGLIPAYHIGGQYRFNRADLLEWATEHHMELSADMFQDAPPEGMPAGPPRAGLAAALEAGGVLYDVEGGDKAEVLRAILDVLGLPEEVDRKFLFEVLLAREALGSTGIGGGFAIPHVRNPVVLNISRPAVAVCFLKRPVDYGALDGAPVHTIFLLVTPTIRAHLHLLSHLAFVLRDAGFKAALARRAPRAELLAELARAEAALAPQAEGSEGTP